MYLRRRIEECTVRSDSPEFCYVGIGRSDITLTFELVFNVLAVGRVLCNCVFEEMNDPRSYERN